MHTCEVCLAKVGELRRGRCWGCYSRWADARPVGMGARCTVCNERRRKVLRSVEILGGWWPMCFNCQGQAMSLASIPGSVIELKRTLERERRKRDRRYGKADGRVYQMERRVGERRTPAGEECPAVDDDMIIEIVVEDATGMEFEELTQIHELPMW